MWIITDFLQPYPSKWQRVRMSNATTWWGVLIGLWKHFYNVFTVSGGALSIPPKNPNPGIVIVKSSGLSWLGDSILNEKSALQTGSVKFETTREGECNQNLSYGKCRIQCFWSLIHTRNQKLNYHSLCCINIGDIILNLSHIDHPTLL